VSKGQDDGILIIRIEESLVYLNSNFINDEIKRIVIESTVQSNHNRGELLWSEVPKEAKESDVIWSRPTLKGVVLDLSCVNHVDATGLACLSDTQKDIQRHAGPNVRLHFANVKANLVPLLHLLEGTGEEGFIHESVTEAIQVLNESVSKKESSLMTVVSE
jgi:ABC-type transporter Mla MlaB component